MQTIGIEPDRLQQYFVSAAEGDRFRQLSAEMDYKIRSLGPNPLKSSNLPTVKTTSKPNLAKSKK
jgi:coenzyme F420-reducing hydrogenase delta subunit